jgi:hypothetical protein
MAMRAILRCARSQPAPSKNSNSHLSGPELAKSIFFPTALDVTIRGNTPGRPIAAIASRAGERLLLMKLTTHMEVEMMLKSLSSNNRTAFDIVNVIAGLGLLLSPWYLGYTAETHAVWNAGIVGVIIAAVAIAALLAFHEAEEWINLVLGLWALISPWALDFSAVTAAMWAHVIVGVVVAVLAAGGIWFTHNRPLSTA